MDLEIAGAYIYFTIPIFGGIPVTQTMLSQLIVTIVQIGRASCRERVCLSV